MNYDRDLLVHDSNRKSSSKNPPAWPACLVKGGLGDGLLVYPFAFALVSLS